MNLFNSISAKRPKRNVFNLSHDVKMSSNMGVLTPFLCEEVVPGDKWRGQANALVRLAPMLAPMMHRVNVWTHFFFVPNRLLWNEWEDFITGGPDGTAIPSFPRIIAQPQNMTNQLGVGTLADYLGVSSGGEPPTGAIGYTREINALPFRAYQMIYNEYYRDQNVTDPVEFSLGSGLIEDASEQIRLCTLRNRAWEKDYFTSALPWAQRGAEVSFPITGQANVYFDETAPTNQRAVSDGVAWDGGAVPNYLGAYNSGGASTNDMALSGFSADGTYKGGAHIDPNGTLKADMDDIASTTVNEFRRSIRLQEWLEKNARGGARYIEQILSHFGVRSSDSRLQRPEFIGGGKSPIVISEVLQTSSTDTESPQANMAGHGISAHASHTFRKNIEEHGFVIGIMSILPRTAYQQGTPRKFFKFDKFDYYWPSFAHLGEQPIYNKELYFDNNQIEEQAAFGNEGVFGYTPRYSEYKYCNSRVAGDFKTTLNFWHMGRIFDAKPNLSTEFIASDPTQRIFAVTDDSHKLWIQVSLNLRAVRPMPKYGTPTI